MFPGFSLWAKDGRHSLGFLYGLLIVTFWLAEAAQVVDCPGLCVPIHWPLSFFTPVRSGTRVSAGALETFAAFVHSCAGSEQLGTGVWGCCYCGCLAWKVVLRGVTCAFQDEPSHSDLFWRVQTGLCVREISRELCKHLAMSFMFQLWLDVCNAVLVYWCLNVFYP